MPQDQPTTADADEALADTIEQSERFEGDLAPLLAHPRRPPSRRALLTLALCDVAVEFWVAQRLLIRAGMHTAALALVRLHFEATVRAIWFHHGASDEWLERFAAPMAPGQLAEPVLGPNVDAMLQTLAKTPPPFLAQTLGAFKAATWQPMNSYVHGGIRPVVQSLAGCTLQQLVGVLQNANGMALMTANLLVVALQDPALAGRIGPIQQAHRACLPPMQPPRT
ncbi:MAG: hypothetical protein JNN18_18580 [Rubrivivax sp.]|nr:hypothetical protein [Rubrivivax sp.]